MRRPQNASEGPAQQMAQPRHDHPMDEKPSFEFCVTGQPISGQAKNRLLLQNWKASVRHAARSAWRMDRLPYQGDVALRVTQYAERRIADRDNLLKPIQDALQSIAYLDDRQVKDST